MLCATVTGCRLTRHDAAMLAQCSIPRRAQRPAATIFSTVGAGLRTRRVAKRTEGRGQPVSAALRHNVPITRSPAPTNGEHVTGILELRKVAERRRAE